MNTITTPLSSVQQRTPTKRTKPSKNKNKSIKVVYISNPMKVKTSASEFMALVQELTGQYAESPPDPARYRGGAHKIVEDTDEKIDHHGENDPTLTNNMPPLQVDDTDINVDGQKPDRRGVSSMEDFEPFDDVFTPQMIETISAFLPDTVICDWESAQVDPQMLMRC